MRSAHRFKVQSEYLRCRSTISINKDIFVDFTIGPRSFSTAHMAAIPPRLRSPRVQLRYVAQAEQQVQTLFCKGASRAFFNTGFRLGGSASFSSTVHRRRPFQWYLRRQSPPFSFQALS